MKMKEKEDKPKISTAGKRFAHSVWTGASDKEINRRIQNDPELSKKEALIWERIKNLRQNARQEGKWFFVPKDEPETERTVEEMDEIIAEGLALAEEMEFNTPVKKPERKTEKNNNQGKIVKKERKDFEGVIIPLRKIMLEKEPIFRKISDEWSEFTYSLFAHPMSVRFEFPTENFAEDEVRLTDFPENFGTDETAKVFINLITRKKQDQQNQNIDFLIELRYLGPVNGHQVYEAIVDDKVIFPSKGIYTTSKLKSGNMLHLYPIPAQ